MFPFAVTSFLGPLGGVELLVASGTQPQKAIVAVTRQ